MSRGFDGPEIDDFQNPERDVSHGPESNSRAGWDAVRRLEGIRGEEERADQRDREARHFVGQLPGCHLSGTVGGVGLTLPFCGSIGSPCVLAKGGSQHGNFDSRLALRPPHAAQISGLHCCGRFVPRVGNWRDNCDLFRDVCASFEASARIAA
jgi:hypothetical protein